MIRIDLDGSVLEGDWPAPLGIPLHLELHKARPGVRSRCTTTPAGGRSGPTSRACRRVHDQSGAHGGGELVLVDEYGGAVSDADAAAERGRGDGRRRARAARAPRRVRPRPTASAARTGARSRSSGGAATRGWSRPRAAARARPQAIIDQFGPSDGTASPATGRPRYAASCAKIPLSSAPAAESSTLEGRRRTRRDHHRDHVRPGSAHRQLPAARDRAGDVPDPAGAAGVRAAAVRLHQLARDPRRGAGDRRHRHTGEPRRSGSKRCSRSWHRRTSGGSTCRTTTSTTPATSTR